MPFMEEWEWECDDPANYRAIKSHRRPKDMGRNRKDKQNALGWLLMAVPFLLLTFASAYTYGWIYALWMWLFGLVGMTSFYFGIVMVLKR